MAGYGRAFGMDVLAWSQNLTADRAEACGARLVDKAGLFRESDVVSVHVQLSDRTRGLVGATELALLGPDGYLVNTSRGPIVDEAALLAALHGGTIAGAGLDVFGTEPLPAGHPLRSAPRTVLTPHLGYVTDRGYEVFFADTVEDIVAWLDGVPVRVLPPPSRPGYLIVNPGMPVPECTGRTRSTRWCRQASSASGTNCARLWPGGNIRRFTVRTGWAQTAPASVTPRMACAVAPGLRMTRRGTPVRPAPRPGLVAVGPDRRHPGEAEEGARRPPDIAELELEERGPRGPVPREPDPHPGVPAVQAGTAASHPVTRPGGRGQCGNRQQDGHPGQRETSRDPPGDP